MHIEPSVGCLFKVASERKVLQISPYFKIRKEWLTSAFANASTFILLKIKATKCGKWGHESSSVSLNLYYPKLA